MRWWHSLNCIVHNQDAEATEMIARLKRSTSNRLKHPITGWSSRDLQTILKEPLGSTPERVGWSVSIVLTPVGWIGRIDNYIKGITKDLEIEPSVAEAYQEIRELERDRAPFHQGPAGREGGRVLEAGVQHTDYEYEEDEWDNYEEDDDELEDEGDTCTGTALQFFLRELALFRTDPASVSLAEVLENYGINWKEIRQKNKR